MTAEHPGLAARDTRAQGAGARLRAGLLTLALPLALPLAARAAGPAWAVEQATHRLHVRVVAAPSQPAAGVLLTIPDGGLLPTPAPAFTVVDDKGQRLPDGCLWYDPERACVIVFGTPAGGSAWVYAGRMPKIQPWTQTANLLPGPFAIIEPGAADIRDAYRLGRQFPLGKGTFFERLAGIELGAVPSGLAGRFADYVVGYVQPVRPGRTWVAVEPSGGGTMEVHVDGRKLAPERGFPQLAGAVGQWVALTNRPAQVQIYTHRPNENARLRLAWNPPGTPQGELGGANPKHEGQPMWAARPLKAEECLRSGTAEILSIERRDGLPVALFTMEPLHYLWLAAEKPLLLYRFKARTSDNPEQAAYTWDFGNGVQLAGPREIFWTVEGMDTARITLRVRANNKESAATLSLLAFCHGDRKANINNAEQRGQYRAALLAQVRATPANRAPAAAWNGSVWDVFNNVIAPGEGADLVKEIATRNWEFTAQRLEPLVRWRIEDLHYAASVPQNAAAASAWITAVQRYEKDRVRQPEWQIRRAEMLMYYQPDLPGARRILQTVAASDTPLAARARVRLGDIAFLEGDINAAARLYGEVQGAVRYDKIGTQAERTELQKNLARSKEELRAQRDRRRSLRTSIRPATPVADWRVGAIRDTSMSETTMNLVRQHAYDDAADSLADWEEEFPLSKISGDFIVVEAAYLTATGDFVRSGRTLAAYCQSAEVTNYLPDAMTLALRCMLETKAPADEVRKFADNMKKRFKFHPIGADVDRLLEDMRRDIQARGK